MANAIYIYSERSLREARGSLEDDLEDFLGEAGEVTGGGGGERGWNIDLELFEDESAEQWIERLVVFLREWGVPEDAYLKVFPDDWVQGTEPRRVAVFEE